jgi:hypothetical protein
MSPCAAGTAVGEKLLLAKLASHDLWRALDAAANGFQAVHKLGLRLSFSHCIGTENAE